MNRQRRRLGGEGLPELEPRIALSCVSPHVVVVRDPLAQQGPTSFRYAVEHARPHTIIRFTPNTRVVDVFLPLAFDTRGLRVEGPKHGNPILIITDAPLTMEKPVTFVGVEVVPFQNEPATFQNPPAPSRPVFTIPLN